MDTFYSLYLTVFFMTTCSVCTDRVSGAQSQNYYCSLPHLLIIYPAQCYLYVFLNRETKHVLRVVKVGVTFLCVVR